MIANLKLTVQESIRYRGRSGHYSWVAHRLSGLAILAFLVLHVWDGTLITFNPDMYARTLQIFKHPVFALSEILIYAAVLYHALNGVRISVLDFKPQWWHHQARSATLTWALFFLIFIPTGLIMLMRVFAG
jgi:succinate dehydrogenase / fumarate reductase cytochrome b subunit